jgi:DNA-binding MarR family transcriptional regulator
MHEWARYVKGTGLSMPQFSVLMRLHYRGSCGISDISSHLDVTAAAGSQLVDRLVKDGYLERAEDPHDRRAKQVSLSAQGRKLIEEGIIVRNRWTEGLTDYLDDGQRDAIGAALKQLTEAARKLEAAAGDAHARPPRPQ